MLRSYIKKIVAVCSKRKDLHKVDQYDKNVTLYWVVVAEKGFDRSKSTTTNEEIEELTDENRIADVKLPDDPVGDDETTDNKPGGAVDSEDKKNLKVIAGLLGTLEILTQLRKSLSGPYKALQGPAKALKGP